MSVSVNKTYSAADLKFLNLLSEKFPTIADATTEIINLEAILNLPKGTEHFLTDLHGEYEAFRHVLKNASGVIPAKGARGFQQYFARIRNDGALYADLLSRREAAAHQAEGIESGRLV